MNLERAIELLTLGSDGNLEATWEEYSAALSLGIEALKAWEESRKAGGVMQGFLLPGETEE